MQPQTQHHILPRSRGGADAGNIVVIPKRWHQQWHALFGNMTVDEIHKFIDIIMQPGETYDMARIRYEIARLKAMSKKP